MITPELLQESLDHFIRHLFRCWHIRIDTVACPTIFLVLHRAPKELGEFLLAQRADAQSLPLHQPAVARFEFVGPRIAIVAVAALLLIFSMFGIFTLPRM